jgi:hypothetical protein
MTDELKKETGNEVNGDANGEEDVLFETYIKRSRFGSKFWLHVTMGVFLVLMVFLYKGIVLDKIISPEELKKSVKIFDIDSQWVVKEEIHEKDFHGILLVPQISFRFRNVGKNNLSYVYVLSVFRLQNRAKSLGEGHRMTLRKTLEPGGESDRIVLTCSFGYRAKSKEAFAKNPKDWKSASADIYIKSGTSKMVFLRKYYIIRRIKGLDKDIEVKFAFTPFGPGGII